MRVERIQLSDFKSYQDADLDLTGVQLASVVGANGAGKSSILEAIAFALTGARSMRSLDSFIRQGAEECRVALTFTTGGETYRLTRTRSSRGSGKSTLELARQDESGLWAAEGTGASDTEERVRQILGCDEKTLLQTAIVSQGDAGSFFALRPAQRLEALGSILRLDEVYQPLERHFKAAGDTAKAALESARRDVERLEADVERLEVKRDELAEAVRSVERAEQSVESGEEAVAGARDALTAAHDAAAGCGRAEDELTRLTDHRARMEAREHELAQEQDRLELRVSDRAELEQQLAHRAGIEAWLAESLQARETDRATESEWRRLDGMVTVAAVALEQARTDYRTAEQRSRAAERTHSDAMDSLSLVTRECTAAKERIGTIEQAEQPVCDRCGQDIADAARERTLAGLWKELEGVEDRVCLARDRVESTAVAVEECAARMQELKDRGHEASALLDNRREELLALPEHTHDAIEHQRREARLRELDAIPARLAEIAVLEERLVDVQREVQAAAVALEDPSLTDALTKAREAVSAAQGARERATEAEAKVQQAEAALSGSRRLLSEAEKAAARIEGEVASLAPCQGQLTETQAAAKAHEQEQADAELLRKAMGKWGVPALIVGNVLLSLEVEVNELLALYEGSLALRFESERETRDGARDSLEIIVFDGQDWRPFETFSGGERYRVASAMRLGLARLLAHRSGARVETLIVDEPEGLDAPGRAHLARILERMSESFGLTLLLTHYEDLKDAMPQQIAVSRGEDGLSRVEVLA